MSENNSNSEQLKGSRNPDGTCGRGWTGDDCDIPCCKGICDPPQGAEKLCEENERDYGGETCIYDENLKKCIQPCPQDKENVRHKMDVFGLLGNQKILVKMYQHVDQQYVIVYMV